MEIPIYETLDEFKKKYLIYYSTTTPQISILEYLNSLHTKYKNEWERANGYMENALIGLQDLEYSALSKKYNSIKEKVRELLSVHDIDSFESGIYKKIQIKDKNGDSVPLIQFFNGSVRLLSNESVFYEFVKIDKERTEYLEVNLLKPKKVAEEILEFINSEIIIETEKIKNKNVNIPQTENSELHEIEPKTKQKRLPTPVIIAMLKELGVFGKLNQKGYNRQSAIDTLYQIIGTNKTNIGKYYDSMMNENKVDFTDDHQKTAKNFLNSKGL